MKNIFTKQMMITLKDFSTDNIPIQNQVDLLAQFLIENFEDEIGKGENPNSEGAIEMAVRLLIKLKGQKLPVKKNAEHH